MIITISTYIGHHIFLLMIIISLLFSNIHNDGNILIAINVIINLVIMITTLIMIIIITMIAKLIIKFIIIFTINPKIMTMVMIRWELCRWPEWTMSGKGEAEAFMFMDMRTRQVAPHQQLQIDLCLHPLVGGWVSEQLFNKGENNIFHLVRARYSLGWTQPKAANFMFAKKSFGCS